MLQKQDKR